MTQSIIKPTVGRVVWFYPSQNTGEAGFARHAEGGGPYAAFIAHVWSDHLVNLSVLDANGVAHSRTSVPMYHGECDVPEHAFCGWMPYQKGQAAKTEAAEKELVQEPKGFHPTQRQQLEYALVSGAASHLAQVPNQAGGIANGIKVVLNELYPEPVLANPHTGAPRDSRDVASDPQATLCVKPGEPLKAADLSGFSAREVYRGKDRIDIVLTNLPVIDPAPDSLEREIEAKANKAPRVTPADIEAEIVSEHYHSPGEFGEQAWTGDPHGALDTLTFCVLVLRNGFTVTGESACASPENFNADIGRRIARENAINKVWPLLGFRLRDRLAERGAAEADFLAGKQACGIAGEPCEACQ